jgi:hypothetical protein
METCINTQPSLPTHDSYFFQLLPFSYCHALCTSDVAFLRTSVITLTSQLVLCTAYVRPLFFAGGQRGRPCLLFVRAFGSTGSPGNPHTPVLRAEKKTNFTINGRNDGCYRTIIPQLSAPCAGRMKMNSSSWACIIFLKNKCRTNPSHVRSTCPSKKRDDVFRQIIFLQTVFGV